MEGLIVQNLLFVLLAALVGGFLVKLLRLPVLIGYILAGIVGGAFLPLELGSVHDLAEIGIILLLFSIGLELSLSTLFKVGKTVVFGASLQIISVGLIFFALFNLLGFALPAALVLGFAFSLSSTAVVVKILSEKGESSTIHGQIMIGWLLAQDLAVVPMMAVLPALTNGGEIFTSALRSLVWALILVPAVFLIGRIVIPFLVHRVALINSRELLVLVSVSLALGTAFLVSLFGISAALGAFLAGVVLSETQENHAIFAETRPLRDLFVILFFVTLGFLLNPALIVSQLPLILGVSGLVLILKFFVVLLLLLFLGYHGKTVLAVSLGLAQVGEFSFILLLAASDLEILSPEVTSVGIAVTLTTLILTPLLFRSVVPLWRRSKKYKFISGWNKRGRVSEETLKNHVIVAGFGRVGKWVGQALDDAKVPFVAIDYNHKVVREAQKIGLRAIYGDPSEAEVLQAAGVKEARVVVITIPDKIAQEEIVSYVQTVSPKAKIIARAGNTENWQALQGMQVDKIVQPEFEAAVFVVKNLFRSMGKKTSDINERLRRLRLSHTAST